MIMMMMVMIMMMMIMMTSGWVKKGLAFGRLILLDHVSNDSLQHLIE